MRFDFILSLNFTRLPIVHHFIVSLIKLVFIQFHIRLSDLVLLDIIDFFLFLLQIFFFFLFKCILLFKEPLVSFLLLADTWVDRRMGTLLLEDLFGFFVYYWSMCLRTTVALGIMLIFVAITITTTSCHNWLLLITLKRWWEVATQHRGLRLLRDRRWHSRIIGLTLDIGVILRHTYTWFTSWLN